jgi:hypothetical protein
MPGTVRQPALARPAHCDLGELNHALHRNINSSRGYQPRLNSPHNSLSVGNQPDKKQASSRRHPANSALGPPAGRRHVPSLNTIHPIIPWPPICTLVLAGWPTVHQQPNGHAPGLRAPRTGRSIWCPCHDKLDG